MPSSLNSSRTLLQAVATHLTGIKHYTEMLTDYPVDGCLPALQLRIHYQQQQAMKLLAELATSINEKID